MTTQQLLHNEDDLRRAVEQDLRQAQEELRRGNRRDERPAESAGIVGVTDETGPFWKADDNKLESHKPTDVDQNMVSFGILPRDHRLSANDKMTFYLAGKSSRCNNSLLEFSTPIVPGTNTKISLSPALIILQGEKRSETLRLQSITGEQYTPETTVSINEGQLVISTKYTTTMTKLSDHVHYEVVSASLVAPVITIGVGEKEIVVPLCDVENPWAYSQYGEQRFTNEGSFEHFIKNAEGPLVYYILKTLEERTTTSQLQFSSEGEQISVTQRDHFDAYKSFVDEEYTAILTPKRIPEDDPTPVYTEATAAILDSIYKNPWVGNERIFHLTTKIMEAAPNAYDAYVFFLVTMFAWSEDLQAEQVNLLKIISDPNHNGYTDAILRISDVRDLLEAVDTTINRFWFFNERHIKTSQIKSDCTLLRWIYPNDLATSLQEFYDKITAAEKGRTSYSDIIKEFPERRENSRILIKPHANVLFDDWVIISLVHNMIKNLHLNNYVFDIPLEHIEKMVQAAFFMYKPKGSRPVNFILEIPARQFLSQKTIEWFGLDPQREEDLTISNKVFNIHMEFHNCTTGNTTQPKLNYKLVGQDTVNRPTETTEPELVAYLGVAQVNGVHQTAAYNAIKQFIQEYTGSTVEEITASRYSRFYEHSLLVSRIETESYSPIYQLTKNEVIDETLDILEDTYSRPSQKSTPMREFKGTTPENIAKSIVSSFKSGESDVNIRDILQNINLNESLRALIPILWNDSTNRENIEKFSTKYLENSSWLFVNGMTFVDFNGTGTGRFEGRSLKSDITERIKALEAEIVAIKELASPTSRAKFPSVGSMDSMSASPHSTASVASPQFPHFEQKAPRSQMRLQQLEANLASFIRMIESDKEKVAAGKLVDTEDKKITLRVEKSGSIIRNISLVRQGLDVMDTTDIRQADINDPAFTRPNKNFQSLYPYQIQLIETIGRALHRDEELSVIFKAGVGAGKTTVCVGLAKYTQLLNTSNRGGKKPLFIYTASSVGLLSSMYGRCMDPKMGIDVYAVSNVSSKYAKVQRPEDRIIFRRPGYPQRGEKEDSMFTRDKKILGTCTMVVCHVRTLTWILSQLEARDEDGRPIISDRPYFIVIDEIEPSANLAAGATGANKETEHALGAILAMKSQQNKKIAIFSASADEDGPIRYFMSQQRKVQVIKNTSILVPTELRQMNTAPLDPYVGYHDYDIITKVAEEGFYRRFISSMNVQEIRNFIEFDKKELALIASGRQNNVLMYGVRKEAQRYIQRMKESHILDQSSIYTLFPFHQKMRTFEKHRKLKLILQLAESQEASFAVTETRQLIQDITGKDYNKVSDKELTDAIDDIVESFPYDNELPKDATYRSHLKEYQEATDRDISFFRSWLNHTGIAFNQMLNSAKRIRDLIQKPIQKKVEIAATYTTQHIAIEILKAASAEIMERTNNFIYTDREDFEISLFNKIKPIIRTKLETISQTFDNATRQTPTKTPDLQLEFHQRASETPLLAALTENYKKPTKRTDANDIIRDFKTKEEEKGHEPGKVQTYDTSIIARTSTSVLSILSSKYKKAAELIVDKLLETVSTEVSRYMDRVINTELGKSTLRRACVDTLNNYTLNLDDQDAIDTEIELLYNQNSLDVDAEVAQLNHKKKQAQEEINSLSAQRDSDNQRSKNITSLTALTNKIDADISNLISSKDVIKRTWETMRSNYLMLNNIEEYGTFVSQTFNRHISKIIDNLPNNKDVEDKELTKSFLEFVLRLGYVDTEAFIQEYTWTFTPEIIAEIESYRKKHGDTSAQSHENFIKTSAISAVTRGLSNNPYWRDVMKITPPTMETYNRLEQQLDELKLIKETPYYTLVGLTEPRLYRDLIYGPAAEIIRDKIITLARGALSKYNTKHEVTADHSDEKSQRKLMQHASRNAAMVSAIALYSKFVEWNYNNQGTYRGYKKQKYEPGDEIVANTVVITDPKENNKKVSIRYGTYAVQRFDEWLVMLRDKNDPLVRGQNIGHVESDKWRSIYNSNLRTRSTMVQTTDDIVAEATEGSTLHRRVRRLDRTPDGIYDFYLNSRAEEGSSGNISEEAREMIERLQDECNTILRGFGIYHSVPLDININTIKEFQETPSLDKIYELLGVLVCTTTSEHPRSEEKLNRLFGNSSCARGLDRPIESIIITKSYEDAQTADDILQMSGRSGRPSRSSTSVVYMSYNCYLKTHGKKDEEDENTGKKIDPITQTMFRMKYYLQRNQSTRITDPIAPPGQERFRTFFGQVALTHRF